MELIRDESIEKWLFSEMRQEIGKEAREGIHLTDLLTPKKAYWQKIQPEYASDDELLYFLTGRGHESAMLAVSGYQHGDVKERDGITYTPDIFFNFPVEVKTRRAFLAKDGEETEKYAWYIKQLSGYMSLEDIQQGWLIVWCLSEKQDDGWSTKPAVRVYRLTMTQEELNEKKVELRAILALLRASLELKDPSKLPDCPEWMCARISQTLIQRGFCKTCDKEYQKSNYLTKHKEQGHEIIMPVYKAEIEPKCKYYDICKGGQNG